MGATIIKASEIYSGDFGSGIYDIFKDKTLVHKLVGIIENAQKAQMKSKQPTQIIGVDVDAPSVASVASIPVEPRRKKLAKVSDGGKVQNVNYNKTVLHACIKELITSVKKEADKSPATTLKEYITNIDTVYDLMLKGQVEAEFEKQLPKLFDLPTQKGVKK